MHDTVKVYIQQDSKMETVRMSADDHAGEFVTVQGFWDCECSDNYIHSKDVKVCDKCGCHSDDSPDSRANEIVQHRPEVIMIVGEQRTILAAKGA